MWGHRYLIIQNSRNNRIPDVKVKTNCAANTLCGPTECIGSGFLFPFDPFPVAKDPSPITCQVTWMNSKMDIDSCGAMMCQLMTEKECAVVIVDALAKTVKLYDI